MGGPRTLRTLMVQDVEQDATRLTQALRRVAGDSFHRRVETEAALRSALSTDPWDLVLADTTLASFHGMEAFHIVREMEPDLPFVLVSGALGEERVAEAVRAGVDDYLLEDDLERLGLVVDRALRNAELRRIRRRLELDLKSAQRLEALGRMAGTVAHDFNNMAMVVQSYGDLVLAQLAPDEPARHDVRVMLDAARRASDLTRQLLAFSRRQTVQVQATDPNEAIREVHPLLSRLMGEDVRVDVRYGAGVGPIPMDRSQLEQIVMNLAVNARDAMPQGGVLTLATERVTVTATTCSGRPQVVPGEYASLVVSDTGVGMDDETLAQLFEPFFTTKGEGRGTGLGLSIVWGLVEQCGGGVTVDSSPAGGTTFHILLPRFTLAPPPDGHRGPSS